LREIDAGEVLRRRSPSPAPRCGRARRLQGRPSPRHCAQQVWPLLEAGRIKPVIHRCSRGQAAQAHALMESSQHVGKIVLDWTA
jgi:NADPH2:quinone reductase